MPLATLKISVMMDYPSRGGSSKIPASNRLVWYLSLCKTQFRRIEQPSNRLCIQPTNNPETPSQALAIDRNQRELANATSIHPSILTMFSHSSISQSVTPSQKHCRHLITIHNKCRAESGVSQRHQHPQVAVPRQVSDELMCGCGAHLRRGIFGSPA